MGTQRSPRRLPNRLDAFNKPAESSGCGFFGESRHKRRRYLMGGRQALTGGRELRR